ncbi:heavy-metal-associated domain-containing protein [Novosphingobium sp.]|uniref:heavy-metal-associated domain-containing protein n=1 Tax=Novosphingobium sp. TaxID=1874826 RepID=UPI0025CE4805|nr:heavy-metal-associated domain-containing protein [Novosphingobium sp.]
MTPASHTLFAQNWRPGPAALLLGVVGLGLAVALFLIDPARLIAQVEGDRGIIPVAASQDIQIDGVEVNVAGDSGEEARLKGWQEAAKLAWVKAGGPAMGEGQIQSMVSSIVIEREQIGPRRYVATLGVVFDRARAGQFLSSTGKQSHSAPMMIIPVLYSGGVAQVYEVKGQWQAAWAQFRSGQSPIDYVRPSGQGGESLLITAGQPGRRSRTWWRNVLDQFGASDVLIPEARLERQWPGGPVRATFTGRYGPDNTWLGSFELSANDEAGVPRMLAEAVIRMDALYADALQKGLLKPDTTLNVRPQIDPALAALIAAGQAQEAAPKAASSNPAAAASPTPTATPTEEAKVNTFTVQFSSPDAAAVDAALGAVRSAAGVKGASTTSLAMGGTSLMRVSYAGELSTLAAALRARGYTVTVGTNALSIRR